MNVPDSAFDKMKELVKYAFDDSELAFNHMLTSLKYNESYSFIRLGDGEGKLLAGEGEVSKEKLDAQLAIWFGRKYLKERDVSLIRRKLIESIWTSDMLGMPTLERLSQKENGYPTTDALNCYLLWQEVIDNIGVECLKKKYIVPASYNHWLQKSKAIRRIAVNSDSFTLVSHSESAANNFLKFFSPLSFRFLRIPAETWSRHSESSDHYPVVYNTVMRLIRDKADGEIFFVGGGVLGKIYCSEVKKSGGFGIDMGAVLDGWGNNIPPQRKGLLSRSKSMSLNYLAD